MLSSVVSRFIDRGQSGQLHEDLKVLNISSGLPPTQLQIQDVFNYGFTFVPVFQYLSITASPDQCREYSPCTIQPRLVAFDVDGDVIEFLGSKESPWQIQASVVDRPDIVVSGAIANYSNNQTQFTDFSLPLIGTYRIRFNLLLPDNVNRY